MNTLRCICHPLVCPQPPPAPPETPRDQQPGLPQALMRSLLGSGSPWAPSKSRACFPQPCGALAFKPLCPAEPSARGAPSWRWSSGWGTAWDSAQSLLGESRCSLTSSWVWVACPADVGFGFLLSALSCHLVVISSLCLWM